MKQCEICSTYFEPKKSHAKFCSNACRQEAHRQRHGLDKPTFLTRKTGLNGIEQKTERKPTKPLQVINFDYIKANGLLLNKNQQLDKARIQVQALVRQQLELINSTTKKITSIAGVGGATYFVGKVAPKPFENQIANDIFQIGFIVLGGFGGYHLGKHIGSYVDDKFLSPNKEKKIKEFDIKINVLNSEIQRLIFETESLKLAIRKIPKNIEKQPEPIEQPEHSGVKIDIPIPEKVAVTRVATVEHDNDKILNSRELAKKSFDMLSFKGRFGQLIGSPEPNFYMLVYGKAGAGKSNFSYQFAEYLANNHGRTLYISGEEGLSATVSQKINFNSAKSEYLDFADLKNVNQISSAVNTNKYRFIIIDSLTTLKFEPADIANLRQKHPHLGVVCINQATKQGDARGSNEFNHDAQVLIKVDNGIATTEKNRYGTSKFDYQVFSQ